MNRAGRPPVPIELRFWPKVLKTDDCWEWQAARTADGYGRFYYRGRTRMAHRLAYELVVGPIGDGLEIDHLCRNTSCVRPDHLEPVTPQINVLRGTSPIAANVHKTHCPKGHEYTPENTCPSGRGGRGRGCRECRRAAYRAWAATARAPKNPPKKSHCLRGHPFDDVNTYVDPQGKRHCRACARARYAGLT